MFPEGEFGPAVAFGPVRGRTPGNTIRKVYLCRSQTKAVRPGDLLLFYNSKDAAYSSSQSITTIAVVESVVAIDGLEALVRLTAKRSVFSEQELKALLRESERPLVAIDFLLMKHLDTPVPLSGLLKAQIFRRHPPQAITQLSQGQFDALLGLIGPDQLLK